MKKITIITTLFLLTIFQVFAQNEKDKHFELDVMLGMHSYSNSFFHAINTVTLVDGVPGNSTEFSGYGTSMLPSLNFGYFFSNNIGIRAGFTPITVKNDIEMENGTRVDYNSNSITQYNINFGIEGKVRFNESPFLINMGSGIIAAPYDIAKNIESSSGVYYLSGNNTAFGYYANASFQIRIISFSTI